MRHVTTHGRTAPRLDLRLLVVAWALFAIAVSASGLLPRVPPLAPVSALGSVIACVLFYRKVPAVRAALEAVPPRAIVLAHALRAPIGALFLFELGRGAIPALFALRAGYGDIAVGVLALVVAAVWPRRSLVVAWSIVGFVDLLLALATAGYLLLVVRDPLMASAIGRFGYGLLPTFVVPLYLASHLLVITSRRGSSGTAA